MIRVGAHLVAPDVDQLLAARRTRPGAEALPAPGIVIGVISDVVSDRPAQLIDGDVRAVTCRHVVAAMRTPLWIWTFLGRIAHLSRMSYRIQRRAGQHQAAVSEV
jgi:hypothetical protein